jgi:hypothetical protein
MIASAWNFMPFPRGTVRRRYLGRRSDQAVVWLPWMVVHP